MRFFLIAGSLLIAFPAAAQYRNFDQRLEYQRGLDDGRTLGDMENDARRHEDWQRQFYDNIERERAQAAVARETRERMSAMESRIREMETRALADRNAEDLARILERQQRELDALRGPEATRPFGAPIR